MCQRQRFTKFILTQQLNHHSTNECVMFCPHVPRCFTLPLRLSNFPPWMPSPVSWMLISPCRFIPFHLNFIHISLICVFSSRLNCSHFFHGGMWGKHGRREGQETWSKRNETSFTPQRHAKQGPSLMTAAADRSWISCQSPWVHSTQIFHAVHW